MIKFHKKSQMLATIMLTAISFSSTANALGAMTDAEDFERTEKECQRSYDKLSKYVPKNISQLSSCFKAVEKHNKACPKNPLKPEICKLPIVHGIFEQIEMY